MAVALAALGGGIATARAEVGAESMEQRRQRTRAMPAEEFDRLRRNFRQFQDLPSAEKTRLRRLYQQIEQHPDRAQLKAVMENYYRWVRRLNPAARHELLNTPPAERWAKVREMRQREQRRPVRQFGLIRDRRWLRRFAATRWVESLIRDKLTKQQQSELDEVKAMNRWQLLLQHARRLELMAGPKPLGPEKLSDERLHAIVDDLKQVQPELADLPPGAQRERLGWRLRLWAVAMTPPDYPVPAISEDELQRFFSQEVVTNSQAKDYFNNRPPGSRWHRDLTILYSDAYPEKRPPRTPSP